jgi:hypothetical protein
MTIQIDTMGTEQPDVVNVFLSSEHNIPLPTADCGGADFTSVIKPFVLAVFVGAIGTTPISANTTARPLENVTLVVPRRPSSAESRKRYESRRQQIIAAGVPMLDDDKLREEIRQRRGRHDRDNT